MTSYIHIISESTEPWDLNSGVGDKEHKGTFERVDIETLNKYWHEDKRFKIIAYSADLLFIFIFREREKNKGVVTEPRRD